MTTHVYHLRLSRLLPLPLVWAALTALLLLSGLSAPEDPNDTQALFAAAGALTVITLPFVAMTWQSRLVLTPDGITHHQFGYRVRSPWTNVNALVLQPGAQSLVLRQPGTSSRLLRYSTRMLHALPVLSAAVGGDPTALAEGRLILLSPFMSHWERGPLRDDLRLWAPQLFDASGQPRALSGGVPVDHSSRRNT